MRQNCERVGRVFRLTWKNFSDALAVFVAIGPRYFEQVQLQAHKSWKVKLGLFWPFSLRIIFFPLFFLVFHKLLLQALIQLASELPWMFWYEAADESPVASNYVLANFEMLFENLFSKWENFSYHKMRDNPRGCSSGMIIRHSYKQRGQLWVHCINR